jgi:transcriptional regulator with XRE-family HTH domain
MITTSGRGLYRTESGTYKPQMPHDFTIGDVVRKERQKRKWNQERLGKEAERFALRDGDRPINKSTVSKVEKNPYSSELGTVWRLLAALGLTFSDVERRLGSPSWLGEANARNTEGQPRHSGKKAS